MRVIETGMEEPTPIRMTQAEFLRICPKYRTRITAPILVTRELPNGWLLRHAVRVEIIQ